MCEKCRAKVVGTGYTNHCPKCLWSKHVDVAPGDRAAECGGMMQPIAVEGATGKGYTILQRCERCRFERRNAVQAEDNMDAVLTLARNRA